MQQLIIKHYGYKNQLHKLIEELRELEEVILYHSYDEEHIKEEMADVINLIEQISVFQGWSEDINEIKEFKISRQLDRIQRGE
jgi:predicted house-cleaning noncanonical NTP pyrophosphatase (MazG superfamily)